MNEGRERPFVSVKFTPVGRTYTFLLPDLDLDAVFDPAAYLAHLPEVFQRLESLRE